jgi:hypothetical protein
MTPAGSLSAVAACPLGPPKSNGAKRMEKIPFDIEGGADFGSVPPTFRKAVTVLQSLPAKKLLNCRALAGRCGCTVDYLRSRASYFIPREFTVKAGNKLLYGNPKTIQAFKQWRLQNQ